VLNTAGLTVNMVVSAFLFMKPYLSQPQIWVNFCNDQDIEICAVNSHFSSSNYCILSVYRLPSGNFTHFLSSLDTILNRLYNNTLNIIICGDFNINYPENSNNKLQLDSLLASYNLHSVVDFPTRVTNSSCTAIDNIFINKHINVDFSIQSCPNGLSDHDAQILTLNDIQIQKPPAHHLTRRIINDYYIRIPIKFKLQVLGKCL
jgi:hypothetical protein